MNPVEKIANRYRLRAGYRLADYAEVGLPIYSLNVRVLSIARKKISPTDEFVLKCLDRGLSLPHEIADFLGLEHAVVRNVLVELAQSECIALVAEPSSKTQSLRVTQKGKLTLTVAETEVPEERMFGVHYDALLKRPVLYAHLETVKFEELGQRGLIEIEAFPPKRPRVADVDVAHLARVARRLGNPDEYRRELVAVKSIEKIQKLFLPAVALVYVAVGEAAVQVAFAIDGKLSIDHENSFALMDGPRKQGITQSIRQRTPELPEIASLTNQLTEAGVDAKNLEGTALENQAQLEDVKGKLEDPHDSAEDESLRTRLKALEEEHEQLKQKLSQVPIKNLYTFDHPPLLDNALDNAKNRLLIIAPWVKGEIVDPYFVRRLEDLLRKNVKVYIGYGINEIPTTKARPDDQQAKDSLLNLSQKYSNFHFARLGNTHAKVLIKDSEYAVVTSFNWLSFKGLSGRKFRDEQGVKIQAPGLVDTKFDELVGRFE